MYSEDDYYKAVDNLPTTPIEKLEDLRQRIEVELQIRELNKRWKDGSTDPRSAF
jgi:hypothetical protein